MDDEQIKAVEAAVETVTLTFARAFKLMLDEGGELQITAGECSIPAHLETHWYVQENLYVEPVVELPALPVAPSSGDDPAFQAALAERDAAIEAKTAEAEAAQKAAADAEALAETAKAEAEAAKAENANLADAISATASERDAAVTEAEAAKAALATAQADAEALRAQLAELQAAALPSKSKG